MFVVIAGFGALVVTGVWSVVARHWLPACLVILAAVFWVLVDQPVEGPTLLVLAPGRGLTVADLLAPIGVVIGVVRLIQLARRARKDQPQV